MGVEVGVYVSGERLAERVGGGVAIFVCECGFGYGYLAVHVRNSVLYPVSGARNK